MHTVLDIGSGLARMRKARRLSQRELGERLGLKQQQIARWESTGYRSASLERVDQVLSALDTATPDALFGASVAAETRAQYDVIAPAVHDLAGVIARIREHGAELHERFGVRRVGIFGSFLAGEQTHGSDVDVLVDLDEVSWRQLMGAAGFLEEILGRRVDLVRPETLRPRLRERVLAEVLYVWES